MSLRAAARLESLGFTNVYDYEAGKADWFAAGLPREGDAMPVLRAADVARTDDVTCALEDTVGDAAARARAEGRSTTVGTTLMSMAPKPASSNSATIGSRAW